jgi:hypothetical protein
MEIFTKNSAKCTIFQSTNCNKFSSLMHHSRTWHGHQVEHTYILYNRIVCLRSPLLDFGNKTPFSWKWVGFHRLSRSLCPSFIFIGFTFLPKQLIEHSSIIIERISAPWDTLQNVGVWHFWHSFLKMSVVRFLEVIAKIGIAKIMITKIGILSGMDC